MTQTSQDPPKPNSDHQMALRVLGLGVLVHMLRSKLLWERVAIAAVIAAALGGLAGLDKESRARSTARLVAWLKQQDVHLEKKVKDALT